MRKKVCFVIDVELLKELDHYKEVLYPGIKKSAFIETVFKFFINRCQR